MLKYFEPGYLLKKESWIKNFFDFDTAGFTKPLNQKNEDFWQKKGEKKALQLFHLVAQKVPAYSDFLKKNKIKPFLVKSYEDFLQVPFTDKQNYISKYPLKLRCWNGRIADSSIIAMSSGTSGEPKFWPRGSYQEFEAALIHELIYRSVFQIDKYKTLLVIGFPMGVYVSGIATVLPSWMVSQKYDLTVVAVGNNKAEMLRVARNLSGDFEQTILVGHPFFIKDVIETGKEQGFKWNKKRIRMMFCSEGFTESWREYLLKQAGMKNSGSAINTYGSSETLLIAHETPSTVKIRKLLEKKRGYCAELFGKNTMPNLFQFNPLLRHITSLNDELVFTLAGGQPLIRFNLHDNGMIVPYRQMEQVVGKALTAESGWKLPFLALWGRSDHTMIFYAANIYPEHIHTALNHRSFLKKITGKFTMRKGYYKNMDEYLEINVELRPKIKSTTSLTKALKLEVFKKLKAINMEFRDAHGRFHNKAVPKIKLCRYQNQKYFKQGLKPRYIIK